MNTDEIFERAEHYCVLASQDPETYGDAYVYWNTKAQSLENQGWKKMNGKTQHQKIMTHLKKAGSITVREAMVEYSIQSLTKRIQELREMGHNIVSQIKHHPITGQKYTRYTLQA
jgi:hypothetical protein